MFALPEAREYQGHSGDGNQLSFTQPNPVNQRRAATFAQPDSFADHYKAA